MTQHKLMIKTHNKTKLKYLCYTTKEGEAYDNYNGSGKYWKRHLNIHGTDISTELIFESSSKEDFKKQAINTSEQYNIIESDEWANLIIEQGDGGNTVSKHRWITNDKEDLFLVVDKLPKGWRFGRSQSAFNDSEKQKEFASRVDIKKRGAAIKQAWYEGKLDHRDNSNLGINSKEVSNRSAVKNKLKNAALSRKMITDDIINKYIKIDDEVPDGWRKGMTKRSGWKCK